MAELSGKLEGMKFESDQLRDDLELCRDDLQTEREKARLCSSSSSSSSLLLFFFFLF